MNAPHPLPRLHLVRHGETEWSLSGRHTSRTDIPLTARGKAQARQLGDRLRAIDFSHVLSSPLLRARQTCELASLAPPIEFETDLHEWCYGTDEGLTTAEIRATRPGWNLFVDGAAGGESPANVFARAERLVRRLQLLPGDIAVFSHGHFLRVLAAAWIGLPVVHAQRFELSTASLGRLSYEHDDRTRPIIALWNETVPSASLS